MTGGGANGMAPRRQSWRRRAQHEGAKQRKGWHDRRTRRHGFAGKP